LPEATVIAVGPGVPNKDGKVVPTTVKAGDKVLLPGWGGNSIKLGEEVSVQDLSRRLSQGLNFGEGILPLPGL